MAASCGPHHIPTYDGDAGAARTTDSSLKCSQPFNQAVMKQHRHFTRYCWSRSTAAGGVLLLIRVELAQACMRPFIPSWVHDCWFGQSDRNV